MKILVVLGLGFFAGRWLGMSRLTIGVVIALMMFYFVLLAIHLIPPLAQASAELFANLTDASELAPISFTYFISTVIVFILMVLSVFGIRKLMTRFFNSQAAQDWGGAVLGAMLGYVFFMTLGGWMVIPISLAIILFGFWATYIRAVPVATWHMLRKYKQHFKIKYAQKRNPNNQSGRKRDELRKLQGFTKPYRLRGRKSKILSGSRRSGNKASSSINSRRQVYGDIFSDDNRRDRDSRKRRNN